MKNLLLTVFVLLISKFAYNQIVCAGVSPSTIAGNYSFSWGEPINTWGSPDFNIPGTSISGELMLVDDGSTGNSPASGLPLAYYGCGNLVNDLNGKIAVVYRYDGVTASTICWMSEKAQYAQSAGAIGVLIVNRPGANEDLSTGGGTAAPNVTIPVVLLNYYDGELLLEEMQNGPVTMFIGNKTGLYANDLSLNNNNGLISKSYGVASQLAQNATEFNFELGTRIYNYGNTDQADVFVTANVNGPGGTSVFTDVVGPLSILSGDSLDIHPDSTHSFLPFSLASYPTGTYHLSYSVSMGTADEYPGDNSTSTSFFINDSIISSSRLDPLTQLPIGPNFIRPSANTSTYATCLSVDNANASRIGVQGLYFSASTAYGSGISLNGEEMSISIYRWEDAFADLNDVNLAFNSLNLISYGYYYYPEDLQGQVVYAPFPNPVVLEDDQRFLACVQTTNTGVYFGHDTKTNYTWNENYYLQPLFPIENDGTYFAGGFGPESVPALAIKIFNAADLGINEETVVNGSAYPNPAVDVVTVALDADGVATVNVTDLSGRTVQSTTVTIVNGKASLNIAALNSGAYLFKVVLEDGKTAQFNVVKK
jgi:hypothetical protein